MRRCVRPYVIGVKGQAAGGCYCDSKIEKCGKCRKCEKKAQFLGTESLSNMKRASCRKVEMLDKLEWISNANRTSYVDLACGFMNILSLLTQIVLDESIGQVSVYTIPRYALV